MSANKQLQLERYLITEKKITGGLLLVMSEKIQRYDDIFNEFCYWLEHRNYNLPQPLVVNGYTAEQIYKLNPELDGIGVYNFLITLREAPERAEQYIKEGFRTL
ncbi:hypothetical protein IJI99_03475 [bacterium]|nr:hypothetical protein [bacterium]